MEQINPLFGHHDESSAFLVADYPYSFRLRTQIRYWTEATPKKGVRFVSQTLNPKTGRWNKPKKSTYSRFAEGMYLDEKGHVESKALTEYSKPSDVTEYLRVFGLEGTMVDDLAAFLKGKAKLYEGLSTGAVFMTVNGVRQVPSEFEVAGYTRDAEEWATVRDAMQRMVP